MPTTPAPARRLFIGLFPESAVQQAILDQGQGWYWPPGTRRTRGARMHITLHFLGAVEAAQETVLRDALGRLSAPAFTLQLRTPQAWTNHIAVLIPDENPALRDLHERLGEPLREADLHPSQHRWTPHVTLARDALGASPPDAPFRIDWPVNEFVLVWSHHQPTVRYEVLQRHALRR